MASALLMIIDDIAALADDVATMSKVAMKKTAGVLGDDLALNAEQVTGVKPSRELHVVSRVALGSLLNKVILIPTILILSLIYPPLITILLFCGGAYLCFEGVEAILHKFFHKEEKQQHEKEHVQRIKTLMPEEIVQQEKDKIKGAIKTDFILSGEILVISFNVMDTMTKDFSTKAIGLCFIGLLVTVLVYGVVALIVKADDVGLWLNQKTNIIAQKTGSALLWAMPKFLKVLSFVGMIAMLLVGGSIVLHSLPFLHSVQEWINGLTGLSNFLVTVGYEFIGGFIAGLIVLGAVKLVLKLKGNKKLGTS